MTYESLSAVLAHYASSDWRAEVAIVTGDLIQDDTPEAYVHFREQLANLGMPVYCLPGNHDIRALMRDALSQEPFRYCESLETGNWLIVGIDSCVTGEAGGRVTEEELDRMAAEISATSAENVMVCLHHPPVAMNSAWLDSVGMDNGDEFLQRVGASGKVRLVVFGHVHQDYDRVHDGIHVIGTPSTCRQFMKGSPLFAVDDHPPAYRRISLYTDGRFDHELIWVHE